MQRFVLLDFLEYRGFFQAKTQIKRNQAEQAANGERHTPTPFAHRLFTQSQSKQADHGTADQEARNVAELQPTGEITATFVRRVFRDKGAGSAVFATSGKALEQPHQHQEDRRKNADAGVTGNEGNREGGNGHQRNAQGQRRTASVFVADRAEDKATQWADQKTGGEGGVDRHQLSSVIFRVEKRFADDARQRGVQRKVEPFDHVAKCHAYDGFRQAFARLLDWRIVA
ncbi:hypothetical protein D3C84_691000 [compost metagenome]